jgi:hypothetical protein
MQIARVNGLPDRPDVHIRIYNCPACHRELRLTVWSRLVGLKLSVLFLGLWGYSMIWLRRGGPLVLRGHEVSKASGTSRSDLFFEGAHYEKSPEAMPRARMTAQPAKM